MKLNLKEVLLGLNEKPLTEDTREGKEVVSRELTLGRALSNILLGVTEGGKMKLFILAQDCYRKDELDVDAADLALIKKAVETTGVYLTIVTGQILLILENIKE